MKKLSFCLTFVFVAGVLSAGRTQSEETFYSLKIDGRANCLDKVSINGKTVVSGTVVEVKIPLPITSYLLNGMNTLEVEYTSDTKEGLIISLEKRKKGSAQGEVTTLFSSPAGATGGKKVKQTLTFEAKLNVAPKPNVALTDADKQAIRNQIQSYHMMLAKRDVKSVVEVMTRAIEDAKAQNPQLGKALQEILVEETKTSVSNPNFKMKPLQLDGLNFKVDGEFVVVRRAEGRPVFESEELEVEEEFVTKQNGHEMRSKVKSKTKIAAEEITFKKDNNQWRMVFRLP
jgi:hypothetical protein